MCQRAELAIAKQPRDFGNRQFPFAQVVLGERGPEVIQYTGIRQTLVTKFSRQRSRAHAKPSRSFRSLSSTVWQQQRQYFLDVRAKACPLRRPLGKRLFRIAMQQIMQIAIAADDRKRGDVRRKRYLVGLRCKFNTATE